MKSNDKVERGQIRSIKFDKAAQTWWWSLSKGQRVIYANMAGITINGKCIADYNQIMYNGSVEHRCYELFA